LLVWVVYDGYFKYNHETYGLPQHFQHRPALEAFHQRTLTIGIGKGGYTIEAISEETNRRMLDASTTRISGDTSTAKTTMASLSSPESESRHSSKIPPVESASDTVRRLCRLFSLALNRQSVFKSAGVVAALIAQAMVTLKLSSIGGRMMGSVFEQDRPGFIGLVKESVGFMGLLGITEQVCTPIPRTWTLRICAVDDSTFGNLPTGGRLSSARSRSRHPQRAY
jgi:hypothetical protein